MMRGIAVGVVIVVVIILSWMVIVDAAVFEVEQRQGEVNSRYETGTIP
jgi:NADH:ubiquinone oxidoreductase subunit 3 (subunit A)